MRCILEGLISMQNYNFFLFFIFFSLHSGFTFNKQTGKYNFSDDKTSFMFSFKKTHRLFSSGLRTTIFLENKLENIQYTKQFAHFFSAFIFASKNIGVQKIIFPLQEKNFSSENQEKLKKEFYLKCFLEGLGGQYIRYKNNTGILSIEDIKSRKTILSDQSYLLYNIKETESGFSFIHKEDKTKIDFSFDKKDYMWRVLFSNKNEAEKTGIRIISFFKALYDTSSLFQEQMPCLLSLETTEHTFEANKKEQIINLHAFDKKDKLINQSLISEGQEQQYIKDFLSLYNKSLLKKQHSRL